VRVLLRYFCALGLIIVALTPASLSAAGLAAYEAFNYSTSLSPAGAPTTALGFTGTYRTQVANGAFSSPSLTYTDGGSHILPVNANRYDTGQGRLIMDLNTAAFSGYLDGSNNIGLDGTSIYVSVLLRNTGGFDAFSALEFRRDSDADIAIRTTIDMANGSHGATDWFLSNWTPSGSIAVLQQGDSLISANANVNFFVLRFDFGSSNNDSVRGYTNPSLTGEPGSADGLLSATDLSFDRLSLANFADGGVLQVDEIRIGTTYASVVPEPSTLALALAGVAASLGSLRRRFA
jgi:hypothetical protein